MDLQLANRSAVVVGGARGIGAAIAREFAREKCRVAIVDRAVDVAELASKLGGTGHQVDVLDYAAMKETARAIGRVDHLVFAVGVGSGKFGFPFWDLEPGDWPRVLETNVLTAVNTLHAFVPAMVAARGGTILLISSVAGQIGSQTDPPYSAAKAALINFAQCAAKDLAPYDVRVNTLCPGMVKTDLNRSVWQAWADKQPADQRLSYEAWTDEKIRKVVPLGRWQEPADMAAMAVFLASPLARNICGQTLNVDGGFVMHW
jgi:NAD(P)-dependent dehydrogenase (short-subunit alcohol dehydrogenase family)